MTASISLPSFPLSRAKNLLTPEKWTKLIHSLAQNIDGLLRMSDGELQIRRLELTAFFTTYLNDVSKGVITRTPNLTSSEHKIRTRALQLAYRVRRLQVLDPVALLDLTIIYQRETELDTVREILESAEDHSKFLINTLFPKYTDLLRSPFIRGQDDASNFLSVRLKAAKSLHALLRSKPNSIMTEALSNKNFIISPAYAYSVLDQVAAAKGGFKVEAHGAAAAWQTQWLEAKVELLDTFHAIMDWSFTTSFSPAPTSSAVREKFFDVLITLIDASTDSSAPNKRRTWFVDLPLLVDYEHAYHLAEKLRSVAKGDAMVDYVAGRLDGLENGYNVGGDTAGGLRLLLQDQSVSVPTTVTQAKGKERAVEPINDDHDLRTDVAVTQVLDIFPDENRGFIKAALKDPSIGGSAERLIAALLEDNLSAGLQALRLGDPAPMSSASPPKIERRNVFDDEEMDFSKLQVGKSSGKLDTTFTSEMKADILRRAQEQSDDEETYVPRPRREIVFEEDIEDAELAGSTFGVGDGEESEDDEDDGSDTDEAPAKSRGPTEQHQDPDSILVPAYIRDPKLFDRDGGTRRSKARADLRKQIEWGDEQIEGWRIMLDRNPRKDKILEKYTGHLNRPNNRPVDSAPNSGRSTPNPRNADAGPSHGDGGGRGHRGSRGRGRGGRGRGGGPGDGDGRRSAQDNAYKAKHKSKMRQGGHDKKMARGGGPPV